MFDNDLSSKRFPLIIEGAFKNRSIRCAIPMARVRDVTLFAMKVGVNSGAERIVAILDLLMRAIPLALAIKPQRLKMARELRLGLCFAQR